ncbi:YihY/virulence factor BrkB family protein [Virgibacillus sp. MSJ-26]|uniref:YihY/virulence factor BrkB family protein n=1 Tax=Virgibacillus sp. MSJ-26 TaxID=2841522 RepID=UPI001C0FB33C|nr:YihY/virulence factor BrkB family protein [Virgibacillus sp. MSJ-26]
MKTIVYFSKELYKRVIDGDYFGLSAQLAYFFLLSLFPLLLFSITLLGYLPLDEEILLNLLGSVVPTETMDFISSNLADIVNNQNTGLLSFSIIGTLWSASNGVNAIRRALNRAYNVEEDRSFFIARLVAILMTVSMIGVIVIAILLQVLGRSIGIYLFSLFGLTEDFIQIWDALRWSISSLVFFTVFLFVYKFIPNHKIYFKEAAFGAVFSTLCWQLVSYGFSFYVDTLGNYSATYGSLGAIIILMIWFYISGFIIILGGVINAIREDFTHVKKE